VLAGRWWAAESSVWCAHNLSGLRYTGPSLSRNWCFQPTNCGSFLGVCWARRMYECLRRLHGSVVVGSAWACRQRLAALIHLPIRERRFARTGDDLGRCADMRPESPRQSEGAWVIGQA